METEEQAVCGFLVFLTAKKPLSPNSSKYLLRYGDVVRIGSKDGDDIRLKHLTDLKTDAVLIIGEDTGFVQATNPEYAETILNDSRLSAPKYLIPGDQLHIKGKIFMYDANLSAEDIDLLKAKNLDGSIRQVPKKRHSVMMYSIANSLKKDENGELPIPQPTVFVREGFAFQAEYLPSPVTPSKTNYVATTPRMRKLSVRSEMPKTANNVLAKRKTSLRRYSMDVSSRSLGSPFLRLRKSHAPSPKQVLKAMTDEDLIDWTTPPMSSAPLLARKSAGLLSGPRLSFGGNVTRRSTRNSTVNKTFEDQTTGRKSSFVGRQSLNQNSMGEESSSPNLTTGRKSANITRWSNDDSEDDDDDVVFVDSNRMSDYVYHGSFRDSFVDDTGRKSQSSAVGRQSIVQNIANSTIGVVEENDEDLVLLEGSITGDKGRRSTTSGRKSLVVDQESSRRRSRTSTVPNMSMNETKNIVEETPQVERFLPRIRRKTASPNKSGICRSSFVQNLDGSYVKISTIKSPATNTGRKSTSSRVSRKSWVNQNEPPGDDSDVFEDEEDFAEDPSTLDESVPASGRKSGFQKTRDTSEFYEDDFDEPSTISERRSMRSSQISAYDATLDVEDQEEHATESPVKTGRKSANSTISRRSGGDQTMEIDPEESTVFVSGGKRKSRSSLLQNTTSENFDTSALAEENFISEKRFVRYPRSALSKTLNDFNRQSPRQTSIGRKSTPLADTRRTDMDSPAVGRLSTLSRRSTKSQIPSPNKTEEYMEELQDLDQEESFALSPTKGRKSELTTSARRSDTSRRSTRSEIVPSNTTAEEDLETESNEVQSSPRKSIGRISATSTITRKSARSEVLPSKETGEYLEESQSSEEEDSFAQSPTKGRMSELTINTRRSDIVFPVVGRHSTSRRSTRSEIVPSNTTAEEDLGTESYEAQSSPRKSIGRISAPSTITRRSTRSELPSKETGEYLEESQSSEEEDSFAQSPTKGRMSELTINTRRSDIVSPVVGRHSTFNTTAEEDLGTESYEAQSSPRKSIGRISAPSTITRRSTRSEILPSNETGEYLEESQRFDEEESFAQSPTKGRKSELTINITRCDMVSPVVGRHSTSRRSTRSEIVPSNTTAEEDLETESYEAQSSPRKSNGRISAASTITRRTARSEILPFNKTGEDLEELQGFDEEESFAQSPTKGRKSEPTINIRRSDIVSPVVGRHSTSRRSTRSEIVPSNTTAEEDLEAENYEAQPPLRKSVGRNSTASSTTKRSGRTSEFVESNVSGGGISPVVGRQSSLSRRSARSERQPSNDTEEYMEESQDLDQEDSFAQSLIKERKSELTSNTRKSDMESPVIGRQSTSRRSTRSEAVPSNTTAEEDLEAENYEGQSPPTKSVGRNSATSSVTKRSGRTSKFIEANMSGVTSPVVGRQSSLSRRSTRFEIQPSNETEEYVEDFDQEDSFAQSPTKGMSTPYTNTRRSEMTKSPVVGRQSISRRSTKSQIAPSNATAEETLETENYEAQSLPRKCITRRSTRSEILPSNETGEYFEESQDFDQEDSFAQSPKKGRKSGHRNTRISDIAESPVDGRLSISRRSTRSDIALSNMTREEDLEAESYEAQSSPSKSIGRVSATSTERSVRSEVWPCNETGEYLEKLQDFDQDDSFGQSPTKDRKSAVSRASYSEESFHRRNRGSTRNQLSFAFEEKVSTDRRPTLYKNVLSKTLNDSFKSPRPSVGRKSATIAERSARNSEIADVSMADAACPVVDRRSTMSRKSTRSIIEEANQSGNQEEPADDSVFEEEVCPSNVASPVVASAIPRRSTKNVYEQANESNSKAESIDESVLEEVSDRRRSCSQNALSKTLTIFDGQSPRNISIGRKSAPSKIARRSDKIMDILDLSLSNVASPVVDRSSTMSRRSARSVIEQSNDSSNQVEPADESVLEVSDRRPSRSQNALSKTLTNIYGQSPRNVSIGRKSAPPKIARRSDKILEILDIDLSNMASPVADRRSTYSRRATRSLANPSDNTVVDLDEEESPMKSAGRMSAVSTASRKTKHSVLEIHESPDVNAGSRSTRRSTRNQLAGEEESSSSGNSIRKSMRNQNKTCDSEQEEDRPESPVLSSGKFQRSSRSSSQSPMKVRQLQENILMGSPDLGANKLARSGRSSLKLPQYDDVTMEEEDAEAANHSDQENSEDEINISGIRRLQKSPNNDLTDVTGVKHLFTGPTKTPKLDGIKAIFNHERSPENDLTDIRGVKKLFTAKSPLNDLSNIAPGCVKEVFRAGPYNSYSHVENLKDVFRRSPRNELTILGGVKRVFRANAPKDDLTNVDGVKTIFKNTAPRQVPDTPDLQEVKMFKTPKTVRKTGAGSFAEKLDKEPTVLPKDTVNSDDSFDSLIGLIGKPAYRTYKPNNIGGSPGGSRKIMNDSLSETFDSIKKKRKLAKTPRPLLKEDVSDISGSHVESEAAGESLPRLSLDLFNAKRPEENLEGDVLEETPARIIKNTSTPLPISSSRTRSKRNLMATAEPKDESVAKEEHDEKPTRSTRRNLTSNETPQEDKPAPRTRRKLASTDTPEKPTRSQRGKKMEEVKDTVKNETSKPSRSRRNQAKEIFVEEEKNLEKPDTPKKTLYNDKDNTTSNDEDNKEPTEISIDNVLPKRSSKRKIAEHVEDSPLPAAKTKRTRRNAKKMDKVENDEEHNRDLESVVEVTNDESVEEPPVVPEKPARGRRNAKKVDKLEKEEHKADLETGKDEVVNDESAEEPPVVAERPTRGRKNAKKMAKLEKEEHIPLPKDASVQKSPVAAKSTRGTKKKNLDKDAQESPVSKDKIVQEEEHIILPKDESQQKSPVVAAKSTRVTKKKNLGKVAQETPVSKDKPVQEEEHILLPKDKSEQKSPVVAAKSSKVRKNTKKNLNKGAQEPPVSKDKPVQEEEHILLSKDESEQRSPVVAAKSTRARKNTKKNLDKDAQETQLPKDKPVQEEEEESILSKDESEQKSPAVAAKPTRGTRKAKKNLDTKKDEDAQQPSIAIDESVQETPVIEKKPTRSRRNAKKADITEKEAHKDDLDLDEDEEQIPVAKDEPAPKSTRNRRNAKKVDNTEKEDHADDLETDTSAVADKPKPRSRRNANGKLNDKNEEKVPEKESSSASEVPEESKTSKRGTRNTNKNEIKHDTETEKESKPQRGKRNAKEIKIQSSDTDEEDVEEKKAGPTRTSRHVRFNEKIEDHKNESNINEEAQKPSRGKRAASKKTKIVESEDDTETIETPEEAEDAVSTTRGKRGTKRTVKTDVAEEVESHPAKKGKAVKNVKEAASKKNQPEEVVEETIRKSKRLRK